MNRLLALLLLVLPALPSCVVSEADLATCDAISPEYSAYVEADPALSDTQKARRHKTIQTWRVRVGLPVLPKQPSELRTDPPLPAPQTKAQVILGTEEGRAGVGKAGPATPHGVTALAEPEDKWNLPHGQMAAAAKWA